MFSIKPIITIIACFFVAQCFAQQKQLGDDQYFKNNLKSIIQPLPVVTRWIDNTHFLMLKDA